MINFGYLSYFSYQSSEIVYILLTILVSLCHLQSLKSKVNLDRLEELFNDMVILFRTLLLFDTCNIDTLLVPPTRKNI